MLTGARNSLLMSYAILSTVAPELMGNIFSSIITMEILELLFSFMLYFQIKLVKGFKYIKLVQQNINPYLS